MKVKPTVLASILMTGLSMLGLWLGAKEFAIQPHSEARLVKLSHRVMEESIKNQMLQARLEDFQQEVALNLPSSKVIEAQKSLRALASVIPKSGMGVRSELRSQRELAGVRELYVAKKFEEAMVKSQELISHFPESSAQLEASYYMISSYYQTGNRQEALSWAEKMLAKFPESEWTAKSLLVMADIYKEQNRKNDLLDICQIILDTFKEESIRSDVKKRLSSLEM